MFVLNYPVLFSTKVKILERTVVPTTLPLHLLVIINPIDPELDLPLQQIVQPPHPPPPPTTLPQPVQVAVAVLTIIIVSIHCCHLHPLIITTTIPISNPL